MILENWYWSQKWLFSKAIQMKSVSCLQLPAREQPTRWRIKWGNGLHISCQYPSSGAKFHVFLRFRCQKIDVTLNLDVQGTEQYLRDLYNLWAHLLHSIYYFDFPSFDKSHTKLMLWLHRRKKIKMKETDLLFHFFIIFCVHKNYLSKIHPSYILRYYYIYIYIIIIHNIYVTY